MIELVPRDETERALWHATLDLGELLLPHVVEAAKVV
jgi:hypothetical protein